MSRETDWICDDTKRGGFIRHLVREHDYTAEDLIGVLEKPWKWQAEFDAYCRSIENREQGSRGAALLGCVPVFAEGIAAGPAKERRTDVPLRVPKRLTENR